MDKEHRRKSEARRGAALVILLAVLSLCVVLVVGFLTTVRQDVRASGAYASGATTEQLATTAVELVKAQVRMATADGSRAWMSQPGLIRTFGRDGQESVYKLYSADQMVIGQGAGGDRFDPEAELANEVPADWDQRLDEFIDLNEPVRIQGEVVYPIVDPRAALAGREAEGFSYGTDAGKSNRQVPGSGRSQNELPMPVRWVYQFEDGTFGSYDDVIANGGTNPPVARLAFWADDEACKVNINTASEGKFFDAPKTYSEEGVDRSIRQPVRNEFNRFPGHPASTSLSAVLPGMRQYNGAARYHLAAAITPRVSSSNDGAPVSLSWGGNWAGSQGGVVEAWRDFDRMIEEDSDRLYASIDELLFESPYGSALTARIRQDGELLAGSGNVPLYSYRFFLTTSSKSPELNMFNQPQVSLWPMNPDEAPANWQNPPFSPVRNLWTAKDKLLAHCATLGRGSAASLFYFQRQNGLHPTWDYEQIPRDQALYRYLLSLTEQEIPGLGASFSGKYGVNRYSILTQMMDYLRSNINIVNGGEGWGESLSERKAMRRQNEYFFPALMGKKLGAGYASTVPLVVEEDGVVTKGLGRFGTFPAVNLLFVAEKQVSFHSGTSEESGEDPNLYSKLVNEWQQYLNNPTGDRPPDKIRRYVRVIMLPHLYLTSETKRNPSCHPRFQFRIDGGPLTLQEAPEAFLPNSMVNGNATLPNGGDATFLGNADRWYVSTKYTWENEADAGFTGSDQARWAYSGGGDERGSVGKTFGPALDQYQLPFASVPIPVDFPIAYQDNDGNWQLRYRNEKQEADEPPDLEMIGGHFEIRIYAGPEYDPNERVRTKDANDLNLSYPLDDDHLLQRMSFAIPNTTIPIPLVGTGDYMLKDGFSYDKRNGEAPGRTFYQMRHFAERAGYLRRAVAFLRAGRRMGVPVEDPNRPGEYIQEEPPDPSDPTRTIRMDHEWPIDVSRGVMLDGDSGVYGDVLYYASRPADNPSSWWTTSQHYDYENQYMSPALTHASHHWHGWDGLTNGGDRHYQNRANLIPGLGIPTGKAGPRSLVTNGMRRKTAGGGWSAPGVGDFQNGVTRIGPGSFIPYVDTGWAPRSTSGGGVPYIDLTLLHSFWDNANMENHSGLTFSPTRQIPSAIRFGWIPSRAMDASSNPSPWETLLFNPAPLGGRDTHRGWAVSPPDHYLLDWFWMPVVEPYAISEPFATAGKVNLNYQIAPFTYIRRATGLHAVMKHVELVAAPDSKADDWYADGYKNPVPRSRLGAYHHPVDVDETLKAFDHRFANNEPFLTASQITEMFLYPEGGPSWTSSNAGIENWWATHRVAGDNLREMPYDHIYPRVSARSNAFKVHLRVQRVRRTPEGRINVLGEYRGEEIVERYLDPNLQSYGQPGSANIEDQFPTLSEHYRFRTYERRRFGP